MLYSPLRRATRGVLSSATRLSASTRFQATLAQVKPGPSSLTLPTLQATFPYTWLRDACQCPECIHPSNKQKLHKTTDIPLDVRPKPDGVTVTSAGLHIEWLDGPMMPHSSFYSTSFLDRHSSPEKLTTFHHDVSRSPWDVSSLTSSSNLHVPYTSLDTPEGHLAALTQLLKYGMLFLTGVPTKETQHDKCGVRQLLNKFGFARPTFYGEIWDVVVKDLKNERNIAYTSLDLDLHMDLQYFMNPPTFQILHCIRNRVVGGTNVFVDAVNVAHQLYYNDRAAFDLLTNTPVSFHYINDSHHLHQQHPTIELAHFQSPSSSSSNSPKSATATDTPPEIAGIFYGPPFQAPLPLSTPPEFYKALQAFAALTKEPSARYQYTLREGDAVVFDNRRVLHARTAFAKKEGEADDGLPPRWLQGCHFEPEGVLDRARVLAAEVEKKSAK